MESLMRGDLGGRYLHAGCSAPSDKTRIYRNGRHMIVKPYKDHIVHHESGGEHGGGETEPVFAAWLVGADGEECNGNGNGNGTVLVRCRKGGSELMR